MAKKSKETKKAEPVKETKKAEPVKEEKYCTCRTEQGFRMNPPCSTKGNFKCA